jgi:hypothetical protein
MLSHVAELFEPGETASNDQLDALFVKVIEPLQELHKVGSAHLSSAIPLLRIRRPDPRSMCFPHHPRSRVLDKRRRLRWPRSQAFLFVRWARCRHQLVDRIRSTKEIGSCRHLCCNRTPNSLCPIWRIGGYREAGRQRRGDLL